MTLWGAGHIIIAHKCVMFHIGDITVWVALLVVANHGGLLGNFTLTFDRPTVLGKLILLMRLGLGC